MMWGNTEKYKTFSVPIEKEVTKIDKDSNESVVTASCKIKFINSVKNTVCSYHATYVFHNESTLYSCLNVKELLARSRCEI